MTPTHPLDTRHRLGLSQEPEPIHPTNVFSEIIHDRAQYTTKFGQSILDAVLVAQDCAAHARKVAGRRATVGDDSKVAASLHAASHATSLRSIRVVNAANKVFESF